jgi:hypothetical protein
MNLISFLFIAITVLVAWGLGWGGATLHTKYEEWRLRRKYGE